MTHLTLSGGYRTYPSRTSEINMNLPQSINVDVNLKLPPALWLLLGLVVGELMRLL